MFRAKFLLPALVFVSAVALGCSQRPTASTGGSDRALEAKVAKLEKDLKALRDEAGKVRAEAARQLADAAKQVADAAKQVAESGKERDELGKERNELTAKLAARTGERDGVQAQYDGFRKELKELVGKMDAAATAVAPPAVTRLPAPVLTR